MLALAALLAACGDQAPDVATSLPDGDYCNVLVGCDAPPVSVAGGQIRLEVPGVSAVALLAGDVK